MDVNQAYEEVCINILKSGLIRLKHIKASFQASHLPESASQSPQDSYLTKRSHITLRTSRLSYKLHQHQQLHNSLY